MCSATGPAPGAETRVKLGAMQDGTLVAADVECLMDSEPTTATPPESPPMATACYKLTDAHTGRSCTPTNQNHAYRAPSIPQVTLGFELAVTELAAELGMDPIEFRLMNAMEEGDANMMGAPYKRIGLRECLEVNHAHYKSAVTEGAGRGGDGLLD